MPPISDNQDREALILESVQSIDRRLARLEQLLETYEPILAQFRTGGLLAARRAARNGPREPA
jgi:hypothetical protein